MTHVPYRGADAAAKQTCSEGQVQVMFIGVPPSGEHIRAGKLRALAVTTSTRWETLPDIPAVTDFLPGFEVSQWWAIGCKSTLPEIIERLNREITAILAEPGVQGRLADLGGTGFSGSVADLEKFLIEDTAKWAKVVKLSAAEPG